jgi:hypothetical protein
MLGRPNPRTRHRTPPSFAAFGYAPSVENLPAVLDPNGVAQAPMLRYSGKDALAASWPAWGYGPTLALAGAGTAPTPDQSSPLMGGKDGAVLLNAGQGYGSAEAVEGDLAAEDLVVEAVFRYHAAAGGVLIGKRLTGAAGWQLYRGGAEYLSLTIEDADGDERTVTGSGTNLVAGVWYHVLAFINRDEASTSGSRVYLNGVAVGTGVDCSAAAATCASAAAARIGVDGSDAGPSGCCVAYAAAWKRTDWIRSGANGAADMATLAAQRFALLTGTAARIAKGSRWPTVATRASTGALDRIISGVRRFFRVGDNWMRVCERTDINGLVVRGYLAEQQRRCLTLQSTSPSDVAWTGGALDAWESGAGVIDGYTCDGLVADATDAAHYVEQDRTLTAAKHTLSAIVKAGASRWCYLSAEDVANARAYFDLQTGAVGTTGAGCTAYMETLGGGWFRCWIVFTGSVAVHTLRVGAAAADNDDTFEGAGAADTWIQHIQCEAGEYPSAPIMTTAAEVTRVVDVLAYLSAGNILDTRSSVDFQTVMPKISGNYLATAVLFDVPAGIDLENRWYISVATSKILTSRCGNAVVKWAIVCAAVIPGAMFRSGMSIRAGLQGLSLNRAAPVTETSATLPAGSTRICVGCATNLTNQAGGIISLIRIMPQARR